MSGVSCTSSPSRPNTLPASVPRVERQRRGLRAHARCPPNSTFDSRPAWRRQSAACCATGLLQARPACMSVLPSGGIHLGREGLTRVGQRGGRCANRHGDEALRNLASRSTTMFQVSVFCTRPTDRHALDNPDRRPAALKRGGSGSCRSASSARERGQCGKNSGSVSATRLS